MSKDVLASTNNLKTALTPRAERKQVYVALKVGARLDDTTVEEFLARVTGHRQLYAPGQRKNWSKGRMKIGHAANVAKWMQSESPGYRTAVSRELDERSILAGLMSVPECPSKAEIIRDAVDLMRECLASNRTEG